MEDIKYDFMGWLMVILMIVLFVLVAIIIIILLAAVISGIIDNKISWVERDSCWGFFSDKWGNELIREIASEIRITEKLYDESDALDAA